jgi:hypothetical protein
LFSAKECLISLQQALCQLVTKLQATVMTVFLKTLRVSCHKPDKLAAAGVWGRQQPSHAASKVWGTQKDFSLRSK